MDPGRERVPRGTVILKSTVRGAVAVDTAPIIVNELTLMGSRRGRFEAELCVLCHPLVRVEDLIAARLPLSEAPQAFAHAAERGDRKSTRLNSSHLGISYA